MTKHLSILGDGQIWDVKGISPEHAERTFEDLFSGRALALIARELNQQSTQEKRIFSQFKDKGRITGLSVTKALLSRNKLAQHSAKIALGHLAQNAVYGIETLHLGKGIKSGWSAKARTYWKDLDTVIIGGGVSEDLTGASLVRSIRKKLLQKNLSSLTVYQAKFPGKEAGFLGAIVDVLKLIPKPGKKTKSKKIAVIGLDLGRSDIGVGLSTVRLNSRKFITKQKRYPWLFQSSVPTPCSRQLRIFLDSRKNYTKKEREAGKRIRALILNQIADLILSAQAKADEFGLKCFKHVAVAVPGGIRGDYIISSTDYLPFLKKQDGFNFTSELEACLVNKGITGFRVHLINDGIAAGIANAYFSKIQSGKFAFLGVGSGLGGCAGVVKRDEK